MRSTVISFLFVICMAGMALAAVPVGDWSPAYQPPGIDATGGPDAYGYTWIDSNEPGGPVYAWKDISTTGTLVPGLTDDNMVGPFPIGFTFQYYWYTITQYWIGSNGCLKFGSPFPINQTFPASIPLAGPPDDYVPFYLADWWPGYPAGTGLCYRWNNADSLVVSYINLHPWVGPGVVDGPHTFQVILSRADSSITFQYGAQSGTVSNNDILLGIESANGNVGLERAHDTYPPANYSVYWNSPSTTSFVAHDLAAIAAANTNSEGFFVLNGNTVVPTGRIKNVGNQPEISFTATCLIQQTGGGTVYTQTLTLGPLAPGAELPVTFTPNWTPTTNAQYTFKVTVTLAGDINASNNTKTTEVHVMTLPGTMIYEDGLMNQPWSWEGGNGGLGQRFVPPSYPVTVDSIRFYISNGSATAHPFTAQILDDDGVGGLPNTVLFTTPISTPTANQWYGAVTNVTISSGAFFVAWQMQDSLTAQIGTDSTLGLGSRQAWEYASGWSLFRNMETSDCMIRARIHTPGANPNVLLDLVYTSGSPVPPGGGPLVYSVTLTNNESTPLPFDYWCTISQGATIYPAFGPINRTSPAGPGYNINRSLTQTVPGSLPAGAWNYNGMVGSYSTSTVWATDFFPFTKSAVGDGGPYYAESTLTGWEEEDVALTSATPMDFELKGAYPNPFNPSTTISFQMPQASQVVLAVYDLSGRQVAELVNGWCDAGSHHATFDGSNLASGIYIYRLSAGSFNASGKMVMMK